MNFDFLTLKWPFSMMIAGGSGCGKTTLTADIVENIDVYSDVRPERICLIYSEMQPIYDVIAQKAPCPVDMVRGLTADFDPPPRSLLVIDDLQGSGDKEAIRQIFTVKSHHKSVSVVYIVQNLFDRDPKHRTISLNAHYIVLFRNPRDMSQIVHLAKQMFPANPKVMTDAYKNATRRPHSYLLVDLKQDTPDWGRLRSSVGSLSPLRRAVVYAEGAALPARPYPLSHHDAAR